MSRSPSHSPKSSPLPRRSILKAIVAGPNSACCCDEQAFSASPVSVDIVRDERFVTAERLMEKINSTYNAAFGDDDLEHHAYERATKRWRLAKEALSRYGRKLAAKPAKDLIDSLVLAKIADFEIVDEEDNDIDDIASQAVQALLDVHGVPRTKETASSVAAVKFQAEISAGPPRQVRPPSSVNAGNLIIRARRLGQAHDAAIRFEGSIPDDTPQSERAIAVIDRRMAELEELRDEIITGIQTRNPRSPDDRYSMTGLDEYTVYCELLTAMSPWFWNDEHGAAGAVLLAIRKAGEDWSDHCVEQAERWNASQGGANV